MDELREELEMEGRQRGGVIAGLVNWLGEAATSAGAATPLKVRPARALCPAGGTACPNPDIPGSMLPQLYAITLLCLLAHISAYLLSAGLHALLRRLHTSGSCAARPSGSPRAAAAWTMTAQM